MTHVLLLPSPTRILLIQKKPLVGMSWKLVLLMRIMYLMFQWSLGVIRPLLGTDLWGGGWKCGQGDQEWGNHSNHDLNNVFSCTRIYEQVSKTTRIIAWMGNEIWPMCSSSPPPLRKALTQEEPVVGIIRKLVFIMVMVYSTVWKNVELIRPDIDTDLQGGGWRCGQIDLGRRSGLINDLKRVFSSPITC